MKRSPVVAVTIFAGAIPFQQGRESGSCDAPPCAIEPVVIAEQPHSSEEEYETLREVEYVEIPSSPPAIFVKGNEHHLEWESRSGEKTFEITDPVVLKWLRERAKERASEGNAASS